MESAQREMEERRVMSSVDPVEEWTGSEDKVSLSFSLPPILVTFSFTS